MNRTQKELPFKLDREQLQRDLTVEKPTWVLSAYGPGRDAPEQLFGGYPREQSFEEIRLMYLEGLLMGNPQGALSQIESVYREAENQMQNVLNNLDGAIQYVIEAQNKSPNRFSMVHSNANGTFAPGRQQQQTNPFGSSGTSGSENTPTPFGAPAVASGGFGQPSALGRKANPFGTPGFGQPSQPASNAFGGVTSTSAFGQPSALGSEGSAFGQPSALGQRASPFGAPTFGQASQPSTSAASAFGQATTLGGGASAFGQPSALGVKPNPFGAPSSNTAAGPSPFSNFASKDTNSSNTSPFGQVGTNNPSSFGGAAAATGFGQPSALGQKPNPFGASAAPTASSMDQSMEISTPAPVQAGFGQLAAPAPNPFQQAQQQAPNPFGQPAGGQNNANSFGGGQVSQPTPAAAAAGAAGGASPYAPNASRQHPPVSSYSSKNPDGTLRMFKGKAVTYQSPAAGSGKQAFPATRNFDGSFTRIWNPDGAPPYYADTETSKPGVYDDGKVKAEYKVFLNTGRFQSGILPEVPPLREWCTWDF